MSHGDEIEDYASTFEFLQDIVMHAGWLARREQNLPIDSHGNYREGTEERRSWDMGWELADRGGEWPPKKNSN